MQAQADVTYRTDNICVASDMVVDSSSMSAGWDMCTDYRIMNMDNTIRQHKFMHALRVGGMSMTYHECCHWGSWECSPIEGWGKGVTGQDELEAQELAALQAEGGVGTILPHCRTNPNHFFPYQCSAGRTRVSDHWCKRPFGSNCWNLNETDVAVYCVSIRWANWYSSLRIACEQVTIYRMYECKRTFR